MSNRPQPLGDVLSSVIRRLGIRDKLDAARTVQAWAEVAGPQVNAVTDTAWVHHHRLYVKIHSAAWRQELHLQRRLWRDRLNEHLGAELVEEIVFR